LKVTTKWHFEDWRLKQQKLGNRKKVQENRWKRQIKVEKSNYEDIHPIIILAEHIQPYCCTWPWFNPNAMICVFLHLWIFLNIFPQLAVFSTWHLIVRYYMNAKCGTRINYFPKKKYWHIMRIERNAKR
jgi:hypothetical protein